MKTWALEPRARGVGGHRVAGVAGGRDRQHLRAEVERARHRGRQPAGLEGVRRVERLVLDVELLEARAPCRAAACESAASTLRRATRAIRARRPARNIEQRHQLAVAPHRSASRPANDVSRPALGGGQVVSRQQGSAAGTEVMDLTGIVRPGAAGH